MHKDLRQYALTAEDWANVRQVRDWLHLFRDATTQMSTTSSPMLSTTHAIFRGLQDELKNILRSLSDNVSPNIKAALIKAHRKLSDYFYKFDESPYPLWAARKFPSSYIQVLSESYKPYAVLDPRIGYIGVKDDYADDIELHKDLLKSKAALEVHFNQFYAGRHTSPSTSSISSTSMAVSTESTHDFTARFRKRPQSLQSEVEEFFNLPPQDFQSCHPIRWWYSNRHRFPNLYCLARDVLAIPGRLSLFLCLL
jgi:hypothetical protein